MVSGLSGLRAPGSRTGALGARYTHAAELFVFAPGINRPSQGDACRMIKEVVPHDRLAPPTLTKCCWAPSICFCHEVRYACHCCCSCVLHLVQWHSLCGDFLDSWTFFQHAPVQFNDENVNTNNNVSKLYPNDDSTIRLETVYSSSSSSSRGRRRRRRRRISWSRA